MIQRLNKTLALSPDQMQHDLRRECGLHQKLSFDPESKLKTTLMKDPSARSKQENDEATGLLKEVSALQNLKILARQDYKEIGTILQLKKMDKDKTIFEYGDQPNNMYIMLQGKARAEIRNELITDWEWLDDVRFALKDWKEQDFDVNVYGEMQESFDEFKKEQEALIEDQLIEEFKNSGQDYVLKRTVSPRRQLEKSPKKLYDGEKYVQTFEV